MNEEERREYKAAKQREYRAKAVDNHVDSTPAVDKAVDKELWAYAELRAERARAYALLFPVRLGEAIYQTPQWQYDQLTKHKKDQRVA